MFGGIFTGILCAIGANVSFALASLQFTHITRISSASFANLSKIAVAFAAFSLCYLTFAWAPLSWQVIWPLLASGFIGLGLGDQWLLTGFRHLGPGRTLLLFGVQPIFLGLLAPLFLNQALTLRLFWAILCFLACLFIMISERQEKTDTGINISWRTFIIPLLGVLLDGVGVMMTRTAFDRLPELNTLAANTYRCLGALIFYALFLKFYPVPIRSVILRLSKKDRILLIVTSLLGTFVSLSFYLKAVATTPLALVSAIGITSPFWAALFERLFWHRPLSKSFLAAGLFFGLGILITLEVI